jgi:Undecaprenyl-phosphate glucose phosphotransferase
VSLGILADGVAILSMIRLGGPADPEARLEAPPSAALAWSEAQAGARTIFSSGDPVRLIADAVAISDCMVIMGASLAACWIRYGIAPIQFEICSTTLFAVILMFNTMRSMRIDDRPPTAKSFLQLTAVVKAWTLVFASLIILAYLTKTSEAFSRAWAVAWYLIVLLGFVLVRLVATRVAARWRQRGRLARTIAIVDLAGSGAALASEISRSRAVDIRLAGVFYPKASPSKRNGIDDLVALSRLFRLDEVIVTIVRGDQGELPAILATLATVATTVRLDPNIQGSALTSVQTGPFLGHLMLTVQHRPLSGLNAWAKRLEDLMLSLVVLIATAPLFLLIAISVRLDSPGPVLFRQRRLGFNNNVFVVYKFRTMFWQGKCELVVPQARRSDPRVTRVGRFLRRTSLDELPQIFNVLRGDMSLVGPRPHALAHNDKYAALINGYLARHRVLPGITGWAQVRGYRGETDTLDKMEGRLKHDMVYIDNWSILLDLKILAKTALIGFFDRRAY